MTGPKMMTPERLEWLRANADHYHNEGEILELVAHIDALEARLAAVSEAHAALAIAIDTMGEAEDALALIDDSVPDSDPRAVAANEALVSAVRALEDAHAKHAASLRVARGAP